MTPDEKASACVEAFKPLADAAEKVLAERKFAEPVKRLVGVRAEIEPGHIPYHARLDKEEYSRFLNQWAKEMNEFFRDHRHQDVNAIQVIRDVQTACSVCGHEWETMPADETGPECCANCGTETKVRQS